METLTGLTTCDSTVSGAAGLYQVNAVIPADAPEGEQVPVVINVGGVESPAVTIAVQQ